MTNTVPAVLIVDDEQPVCDLLCDALGDQGYDCHAVNSADEALTKLKEHDFDLALLDIRMEPVSGMDLLIEMAQSYRNTTVLMTTAVNDTNTAVEAMKRGAVDYILKPFSIDEVRARVGKALRDKCLRGDKYGGPAGLGKHEPGSPQAQMDAIARGMDAQVARYDFHTRIVTEQTAQAAKQMGLSERDIKAWEAEQNEASLVREIQMKWATGDFKRRGKGRRSG